MDVSDQIKESQARLRTSNNEQEVLAILESLMDIAMTLSQLKETKIGKTLKRVARNFTNIEIQRKTNTLIQKWKMLLPQKPAPRQAPMLLVEKRERCVGLLVEAINDEQVARTIEAALFDAFKGPKYDQKTRALKFNLTKNRTLRESVVKNQISPEKLIHMTPREMATEDDIQERAKIEKDLTESRRTDWHLENNAIGGSMYKCVKCKSDRTITSQMQTRSADEPMTTFVKCVECGHNSKF